MQMKHFKKTLLMQRYYLLYQPYSAQGASVLLSLTTKATPAGIPSSGGQGLSAANAMRYAAKSPPPKDKKPKPEKDLENRIS